MASRSKRKSGYGVVFAVLLVIALVVAFILSSGIFFKITQIKVEGTNVYLPGSIIEASGFEIGENIFLINKVSAFNSIRAKYPYVERIRVRRELPGTVIIEITESSPIGMILYEGSLWLFDSRGILLESVPALTPPDLPLVKGVQLITPLPGARIMLSEDDESKLSVILEILEAMLGENVWQDVSELDMTQAVNIKFRYAGRFNVELGFPDHVGYKLKYMLEAIASPSLSPDAKGTLYLGGAYESLQVTFLPEPE